MKIKKYYLSKSNNTRRMEKIEKVEQIIITDSKYRGFSGLKNRNVIEMSKYKEGREFSCHYIIGLSGEVINIIPESEIAICTKDYEEDKRSIAIMLCIDKNGMHTKVQKEILRELIKKIEEKYNLENDNVLTENDINCSRRPLEFADEPIILHNLLNRKITRIKL